MPMRENPLFGEVVKLEPTFAGERSYQELLNVLFLEGGGAPDGGTGGIGADHHPHGVVDYHQPHFLELMYEKVFEDGPAWFEQIFDHYGLRPSAVREAMAIAEERSFAKLSESRDPARTSSRRHLRSGKPEQWKEEFTPAVSDLFRTMHGLHLIHLGTSARSIGRPRPLGPGWFFPLGGQAQIWGTGSSVIYSQAVGPEFVGARPGRRKLTNCAIWGRPVMGILLLMAQIVSTENSG